MCSNTWAKWLSVIALLLVGSSVAMGLFAGETMRIDSTEITVLLLTIVITIISFSKENKAKKK